MTRLPPTRVVSRLLSSAMVGFLACNPINARGDERFAGMDAFVQAAMESWKVPGLAIAIVKDGALVLARAYGVRELGRESKVTADTVFDIASCAKSFTAACVGLLVDEGKLHWDDPVARHLPDFELADRYLTTHVTLRDLLCHRTGLQRCDLLFDGAGVDTAAVLERLKFIPQAAPLRTRLTYSNPMFTVLGEVVNRVSGQPWEQLAAERIFRPLGMTSTLTTAPPGLAPRHWRSDSGVVARPLSAATDAAQSGASGIYSTVTDLAQWLKLHLAEGTFADRRLLKAETVREMHALQFSVPVRGQRPGNVYAAQFYGSGLGWFVQEYRGHKIVLHGGGWGAMVAMLPAKRLGVVVLSNLDLECVPALIMHAVFDAHLDEPGAAWNRDHWETTWLKTDPPGAAYRPRDQAKAELERARKPGTRPVLPLDSYAGTYKSELYGPLHVATNEGRLEIKFGEFRTEMQHWHEDSFYVRAPTRLTFDWLLTFAVSLNGHVTDVTIRHVGWDKDETDHRFVRGE